MSTCYRARPLPRLHRCDCLFPPPPVPPWSRTLCRPIMGDRRPAPRKPPSTVNFHFAPTHNTATTGRPKSEQTPERRRVTPTSRATITGGTDLNLAGPRHLCPRPHCPRDPPAAGRSWTRVAGQAALRRWGRIYTSGGEKRNILGSPAIRGRRSNKRQAPSRVTQCWRCWHITACVPYQNQHLITFLSYAIDPY